MAAPAGPLSPTERLAFCASLAPEIAQVTAAYYDPVQTHPYLKSPSGGGILQPKDSSQTPENFADISVSGLPTGTLLSEELLTRSGMPEGISPDGVVWSVITNYTKFPANMRGGDRPDSTKSVEHSWNYWDGKVWHTGRSPRSGQGVANHENWISSTMLPEELVAMRAVAAQIRGVHQITDVYQDDFEQFEQDMAAVEVDPETRKWLDVAFAGALTMQREVKALGVELQTFMPFDSTGYQRVDQLAEHIPLGKQDDDTAVRFANSVGKVLANMYRGSATIKRDSMRKRAYRARMKGHPLPLPAAW